MMDKADRSALIKAVVVVVKEWVSAALNAMSTRMNEFDQRLKDTPAGPAGRDGAPGKDGKDGKDGENGLSCDVDGVVAQVMSKIPTPKDGKDGQDGMPGEQGFSIKGDSGADGKDGRDGRDGIAKDGRDGLDGKDALQIEILSTIDPAKSYPRGTFASYKGGLIRALRNTESMSGVLVDELPKSGWEVIVDGVRDIFIEQGSDLRSFVVRAALTSGTRWEAPFYVPMLLYRDIYREGSEYLKGDVVTWDGSAWHCQADTTTAKPGNGSTDWKLIVKRGQAGKDGKDGERGKEGPPGKDMTPMGGRKW